MTDQQDRDQLQAALDVAQARQTELEHDLKSEIWLRQTSDARVTYYSERAEAFKAAYERAHQQANDALNEAARLKERVAELEAERERCARDAEYEAGEPHMNPSAACKAAAARIRSRRTDGGDT